MTDGCATTAIDGELYNRVIHENEIAVIDQHSANFAESPFGDDPTLDQITSASARLLARNQRDVSGNNDGLMDIQAEAYINELVDYANQSLPGGKPYFGSLACASAGLRQLQCVSPSASPTAMIPFKSLPFTQEDQLNDASTK